MALEWEHIPVEWVLSTYNPDKFGFLGARPVGTPVPAVIPALTVVGHRKLLQDRAAKLCTHCGETSQNPHIERVTNVINKLLADHPDLEKWLQTWHTSSAWLARQAQKRQQKKSHRSRG